MRLSALLLALTISLPAQAAIEDMVGLGPRAIALSGSYAARPGDWAAAYYNPAGLAPPGEPPKALFELSLAPVVAHPTLHVTADAGHELSTPETPTAMGVFAGSRFSVGRPFGVDGLNMGLAVYVPKSLFRWSIRPDDDVQWLFFSDRMQVLSAHAGLGYRITDWLSVGAGVRLLFDVQTLTRGEVTEVRGDTDPVTGKTVVRTSTRLGTDARVYGRASPSFGVLLSPSAQTHVGLTYRHEIFVDDWGDTRITGVPGLGNLGYTHRFAHYYDPSQVTLAASGGLSDELDVSADVTYQNWSRGLTTTQNFFGSHNWGDTWVVAAGLSYRATSALSLLGGYRFVPSPWDNFGGPTNLLDNDRHVASLGGEIEISPLGIQARLQLGLSATFLVERSERKDFRRFESDEQWLANPGSPGYHYGGHMLAGSLGMEASW